ncbi:hypothetical protein I7I50_10720 [Histoplasma capsulatum G186AR]|uniref:Uncharacterized protein n=1 Tax=Ajellomyces capsulatus TaxID=5037 RepID=A0A8H7Z7Z3_AJECA|nr:hypothetical protein I7I52_01958 [Histoplasma capsulatum]QSS69431.1 hypothetical protein I7I50_10720 [Histoplasma capsulatum G186AR]
MFFLIYRYVCRFSSKLESAKLMISHGIVKSLFLFSLSFSKPKAWFPSASFLSYKDMVPDPIPCSMGTPPTSEKSHRHEQHWDRPPAVSPPMVGRQHYQC